MFANIFNALLWFQLLQNGYLISGEPLFRTKEVSKDKNYRLSNDFHPEVYNLRLEFPEDFLATKTYNGELLLELRQTKPLSKNLQLHRAKELNLTEVTINNIPIKLGKVLYEDPETEIMMVPVDSIKDTEKGISLKMKFQARIYEDMRGVYLSNRDNKNTDSGIVTTHFQPTFARRAFPCLDEPSYKAIFKLEVMVPTTYQVMSNQPGKMVQQNETYKTTQFEPTPKMSSYLLAFVISNFGSKPVQGTRGLPMTIWAPLELIPSATFASEIAHKIAQSLSNLLNSDQSGNLSIDQLGLGHLDLVAVRDFAAGAMENWGLVTFKENALLWNPEDCTFRDKQRVATVIAHEFAHNWFGNLVTTKWWNTTWLNEGFARYFQYYGLREVSLMTNYELEHQFLNDEVHQVMELDVEGSGNDLNHDVDTQGEIKSKFGKISYSKGAAIIRMVQYMVPRTFITSVHKYLWSNQGNSVTPSDLFNSFTETFEGVTIDKIMNSWTETSGYPIIQVSFNDTEVRITQKVFNYSTNTEDQKTGTWYIPIWYKVIQNSDLKNETSEGQMIQTTKEKFLGKLQANETIVINPQRAGYFRVNYDLELWNRIGTLLRTNIESLDVLTRSQLVDDILNSARAGYTTYGTAFNFLGFLKNELDYHPWRAALNCFGFIKRRLQGQALEEIISRNITNLMRRFLDENLNFELSSDITPIQMYRKQLAIEWACGLDLEECTKSAINLFGSIDETTNGIDPNLRFVVYCTTLRHAPTRTPGKPSPEDDVSRWTQLWDLYQRSKVINEKLTLLSALGCTKNTDLLEAYLQRSIDGRSIPSPHASSAFMAVLEGTPRGLDVSLEFMVAHYDRIVTGYQKPDEIIMALAERLNSHPHVEKFRQFVATHRKDLGSHLVHKVLGIIQTNAEWLEDNVDDLGVMFNNAVGILHGGFLLIGCLVIGIFV